MIIEKICFAVLFVAEALTVVLYLGYLFNQKKTNFFLVSSFFSGYAILFFVSLVGNTTVNAASFCCVNLALIELNYQCTRKTALLHTAFLCFIMVISEILVALLIGLFGYEFSAYTYNLGVMIALIVLSKLLYLVFSVIGSRIISPHKNNREDPNLMILFFGIPLLSASIAIITVYLGMTSGISGTVGIMTIMIVVTLLIVNLGVLALYNYLQKASEERLALQLGIQKDQADVAYYKALQEQFESQRILIHDIKKHLGTIDALAKDGHLDEINKYISVLSATLAPSTHAKLCSDPILNFILLRFFDDCKQQNVTFYCDIRENVSDFMDISSITALYGNLLSNAFEAAVLSRERQIELSVTRNISQSVIVISVINTCDIAPIPDGHGKFYTRKIDHVSHGIGLRSIERIVQKHNGVSTMYFDSQKRQFHHIIQFPIPI